MKLLLLGKDGQVGRELQRALAPLGSVTALGRAEADFSRPQTLRGALEGYEADVVVNAAAYTAVDKAEAEPDLARAVNTESVGVLAELAAARGSWLVHYSTDYVFDGLSERPYREDDTPAPRGIYGFTKRDGELAIAASGARHLIFRTCWVHGVHGANFARTMLRLARERDTLRVVADQIGAPTSAELIADVTAAALQGTSDGTSGLYHLAAAGATSWHGYAQMVVEEALALGAPLATKPDHIVPIATAEYPTAARRPANSRLDTAKLSRQFGLAMPDWREGVRRTVGELVRQGK